MFDRIRFAHEIATQGYSIVEGVLKPDFIERAKSELETAIALECEYHGGTEYQDYGMVLLCPLYGGVFIELLALRELIDPFDLILGEGCIVYAQTSTSMPPKSGNYASRIHVDCPRVIPGYVTNMGALILLDDFTEENGATWFLPYSQTLTQPPSEQSFFRNARRLVASAGTVLYLNQRLWHAGARNSTDRWRHAMTISMCRPWMKQRIDIPRALEGVDLSGAPEAALQKLGFHAQVPACYDEYYLPPEKRKFRQKTE